MVIWFLFLQHLMFNFVYFVLGMVPVPPAGVSVILFVGSASGLPSSEVTLAELAKEKGYKTGLIGICSN